MAELLQRAGYATACIGKWASRRPAAVPPQLRNGFDPSICIPYSEDMERGKVPGRDWPKLPLLRDEQVIEVPVDAQHLTRRLTEAAAQFIAANKNRPFFLYFPEAVP